VTPAHGVSIRIFLADGRPEGLRLVEKSNWTGIGVICARSEYPSARSREEYQRPGVYLLSGPAQSGLTSGRIYVGEADELRSRIDKQAKEKDFWTSVLAFTSKDANLNKAHVRYLESRLIGMAQTAMRWELENGTAPPLPHLSEPDRADMEGYLSEMLLVLPLLGVPAFDVPATPSPLGGEVLRLKGKGGADGRGIDRPDGFVVLEGSTARPDSVPSIQEWMAALRSELMDAGILAPAGGLLKMTKAHVFDSPSSAAGVLLGRSANGRIEWKDSGGRTLKEIQAAQLGGR